MRKSHNSCSLPDIYAHRRNRVIPVLTHETTSGDVSADPKDETNYKIPVKTPNSLQRRVPDYKHHQRTMTSGLLLMEEDCPSAIMDESPIPNQSMLIIDHESIKKNKKV